MPELRDVFEMATRDIEPDLDEWKEQERRQRRVRRNRKIGPIALVVAFVAVAAAAIVWTSRTTGSVTPLHSPTATTAPTANIGTVTITDGRCTLEGGMNPSAGPFDLTIRNERDQAADVVIFSVANDGRFERLLAYVERHRTDPDKIGLFFVEMVQAKLYAADVAGHDSSRLTGRLDPGTYGVSCGTPRPAQPGHAGDPVGTRAADFIGPIQVR
jgi:hypothetical protein